MGDEMANEIELSVVMTIVDGGDVLTTCLDALVDQCPPDRVEVLIPYDHITADVAALKPRYPGFTFVDLGAILGGMVPANPFEMHAFYDTRRAEAMKLARGKLIAIIEDRGVPDPDWAETMIGLHRDHPHGVIGGAVTNGVDRLWNWAIFFCDFGRYQPPLSEENPEYVTDTNIAYKRETIFAVRDLWDVKYQESQVNWELRRRNAGLMLTDACWTEQRRPAVSLGAKVAERFHWARLYGNVRGREIPMGQRLKLCALMPALPFVLYLRHFRRQVQKGRHVGKYILASPLTLFLLICWTAGEFTGTLEAK